MIFLEKIRLKIFLYFNDRERCACSYWAGRECLFHRDIRLEKKFKKIKEARKRLEEINLDASRDTDKAEQV